MKLVAILGVLLLAICLQAQQPQGGVTASGGVVVQYSESYAARADQNPLSFNWHVDSAQCNLQIYSHVVVASTTGDWCSEYSTGAAYPSNQISAVTLSLANEDSEGAYYGVVVRSDGAGTFYRIMAGNAVDRQLYVQKCVATVCASLTPPIAYTDMNNDVLKATVSGSSTTTVTAYINGVSTLVGTDSSTPITAGSPGILLNGNNTDVNNLNITAFCAGSLTATC